ncbi:MAG: methylmalonyl-CoA mutase, partial [Gelidibacter sp.]|nr:methylmalonyl-CoA mutase [Gelidibacter sp.]
MSKQLFKEFPEVSSTEWKQLIQFDLKGLDYNNTLIWSTNEGIDVKPFYHADEFKTPPKVSQTKATQWLICQTIFVANVEKSNEKAVNAIENGATSIKFIIPSETVVLKDLLVNINLSEVEVNIECLFNNAKFYTQLATLPSEAKIVVNNDIIGHLAQTGNWFDNLKIDYEHFESIVYQTTSITVNTALYQNAGATMVQQLAYALAHANEYLNHFDKRISDKEKATITFTFNMAVGANYFFEIAKLRALRNLWSALALCYGFDAKCHIIATPTKRNKTLYDYNTNL